MTSADVTHFSLKEPPLTEIAVPSWIAISMCISAAYMAVWGLSPGGFFSLVWRSRMMLGFSCVF